MEYCEVLDQCKEEVKDARSLEQIYEICLYYHQLWVNQIEEETELLLLDEENLPF